MTAAWSTALTIEAGDAQDACALVRSTQEAAHFLLEQWRAPPTPVYRTALRLCAKAIRGDVSHEAAYISFRAALIEANVAVVSTRRSIASDLFCLEIEQTFAEDMLSELRALSAAAAEAPSPVRQEVPWPFRNLFPHQ
jgi:hypothetical protein